MLLRLLRYRIDGEAVRAHESFLRAEGIAAVRVSCVAAHAGRDMLDPRRFVVVSLWPDVEALGEQRAGAATLPYPAGAARLASEVVATHWEVVDVPPISSPGHASVLRVVEGRVTHGVEADFFGYVRDRGWPQLAERRGLVAAWLGRRSDPTHVPFVAVSLWTTADLVDASAVERPSAREVPEEVAGRVASTSVQQFALLEASEAPADRGDGPRAERADGRTGIGAEFEPEPPSDGNGHSRTRVSGPPND